MRLTIRLTPKSSRDLIKGIEVAADGRSLLKVRVRALPEAGQANAALTRLIAKSLKIPASSVTLESGATARLKILHLSGDPEDLHERLASLVSVAE